MLRENRRRWRKRCNIIYYIILDIVCYIVQFIFLRLFTYTPPNRFSLYLRVRTIVIITVFVGNVTVAIVTITDTRRSCDNILEHRFEDVIVEYIPIETCRHDSKIEQYIQCSRGNSYYHLVYTS